VSCLPSLRHITLRASFKRLLPVLLASIVAAIGVIDESKSVAVVS